jgi:NTE family protein
MPAPTRIALALGSGGARGYAHIGAIQVIQERGYQIVAVAGSSMGALVGGLHAAGQLDAYTEWSVGLSQIDVVRLLDLSLSAPGAIRAEKVVARVRELLGEVLIEDLPVPYTAVATDLAARRAVWFQRGPLDVAIRASIAIPGIITPVALNGRLLADGGIMDPLPIAPMASVGADLTIGISLSGENRAEEEGVPALESAEPRPVDEWGDRFRRSASQLLDRDLVRSLLKRFGGSPGDGEDGAAGDGPPAAIPPALDEPFEELPAGLSRFEVMNQALDVMQSALARYRLAGYPPDLLVSVPKNACRGLDFHRAAEMIELGRTLTADALDAAGLTGAGADDRSVPEEPDVDRTAT